jgi:predicted ATPase
VLLQGVQDLPERDELEVTLRIGLGAALMATRGFGAPEVSECYERARELCQRLGSTEQLFPVVWGMWLFYLGNGSVSTTRELADTLQNLPRQSDDSSLQLQTHHAQWATALSEGDIDAVEEHTQAGITLYDAERHAGLTSAYGDHDPGVCALSFSARAAVLAGRTDWAVEKTEEAITLARNLGHPFTLTLALAFAAFVHQARRDVAMTQRHAAEAAAIALEHGFLLMLGWVHVLEGWAIVEFGEQDRGLSLMQGGLADARATGSGLFQPLLLSLLAETEFKCGLLDEANANIDEAFVLADRNGDRLAVAELYRLRGELQLATAADPASCVTAEGDLRTAIQAASSQGAKWLALRAATTLGRHWAANGNPVQARQLVASHRADITEGRDLPDLAEADALLAGGL